MMMTKIWFRYTMNNEVFKWQCCIDIYIYIKNKNKLLRQALWLQIMEARTVSVSLNQTYNKWEEAATMRTVQITIACTKGEREREKLGTQVLIQPVTERKSFNVNRNIYMYKVNHSNNNYEKNATKKKRTKKINKKKQHLYAFKCFLFTSNENKNSKYIGTQV